MASPVSEEKSDLPSPVADEKYDLPLPKRQKVEETSDDDDSDYIWSPEPTEEEIQLWNDEFDKSQGFEIDFSKLTYCSGFKQLDLDEITVFSDPGTHRDFIAMLAEMALTKHNAENKTSLKLGKILRANYYPSAGLVCYISFEVTDSSDGNQTKPYRAIVRYLNTRDHEVISCFPKPSS